MVISLIGTIVAGVMLLVLLGGEGTAAAALSLLAYGILSTLLSRGLYKNRVWTRGLLITWVVFPAISAALVAPPAGAVQAVLFLLVWGGPTAVILGFFSWYLYWKDSVTAYYGVLRQAADGKDSPT